MFGQQKCSALLWLTVLLCLMTAAVSAHEIAPDTESLWALEDERTESEAPLTEKLCLGDMPLAWESETRTFYCPIGLIDDEMWPEMEIVSPDGFRVIFADDYTYDACRDALRDGTTYEVMLCNDTEYSYVNLLFTGLPVISIWDDEEITRDYTVCAVTVSDPENQVVSSARIHRRGASAMLQEKPSYKIKFTKKPGGKKKVVTVPGIGETNDINLAAVSQDPSLMRDRISWLIYGELLGEGYEGPFAARKTAYAEVILNGHYRGVYLMMEPMDVDEEIALCGGEAKTLDRVYRTAVRSLSKDRDMQNDPYRLNTGYELYYSPGEADHELSFAPLEAYIELIGIEDDERFAERALELIDRETLILMELLIQGGGMTDNFFNNLYVHASAGDSGYTYRFAPWDMDLTWGMKPEEIGEGYENWMFYPLADRMLRLNVGGMRDELSARWKTLRETTFSPEHLESLLNGCSEVLNASGAMTRNADLWGMDDPDRDGYGLYLFADMRWPIIDEAMQRLGSGSTDFIDATDFEAKGTAIRTSDN